MKATLIGVGQAGGKLTQALVDYGETLSVDAIQGALAINTARADMQSLDVETLLIGRDTAGGQGVGADNEVGARIMDEHATEVLGALEGAVTAETEAIVLLAALGGGTGSGGAPVLARELRRVYDQPVYVVGVLPGENEGALYHANAGRSLKTLVGEADATLLVDNDALRSADESVGEGYEAINAAAARRLGLLFAAGESGGGVGESVVDTSEIVNTLRGGGLAAVGLASADAGEAAAENVNVVTSVARRALLSTMSVPEVRAAERALVVIAGRPERIPRKGVERARRWVEEETGSRAVRGGDYPVESDRLAALVVLSGIERSDRVSEFVASARAAAAASEERETTEQEDPASAFQTDELENLF